MSLKIFKENKMIKDALIVLLKELITKFILLMRNDKKRKFHEYIKDKNNIQKNIYEILEEMLNKKIKESKILEEVKNLSTEQKKDIIDYVIKVKNPDFICYSNEDNINIKIIETLSKEIYYRQSVIKKIKEYNHQIIYNSPCVYIFKSLEVFKKEDFFTILNKISCINFFILNCPVIMCVRRFKNKEYGQKTEKDKRRSWLCKKWR